MSWRRVTAAIAFATVGVACSPFGGGAFTCTDSAQCGASGACEPNGLCSFPDGTCGSGRSYGEASGDLAGVCVGEENPDAATDGPMTVDGAADGPPPAPFCDTGDPTLRLCLAFDGDAIDGSPSANTVTTTAVGYAAGMVGQAVVVDGASRLDIGETPALDVAHITMEAWINVTLPGAGRSGIVDNNGQYGFFILSTGDLRCTPAAAVQVPAVITNATWIHVACTYDGTTEIVYVNGVSVGTSVSTGDISIAGAQGTSIAGDNPPGPDRLVGMIDQFRIYSEARTPAQICEAAGLAVCP
jgi:hypothetical protein